MAKRLRRTKPPTASPTRETTSRAPSAFSQLALTWKSWLPRALLILAAVLFAYSPAWNGGWIWDDTHYLSESTLMQDPAGYWKAWAGTDPLYNYNPLTVFVEWLAWQCFGDHTLPFHLLTLALHLGNALFVWALFARLGLRLAWVGGLLFAIYPINVETAAWISELKNTISVCPLLLAMIVWLKADEEDRPDLRRAALVLFAISLLAKSAGVMLPVVLLGFAWWKRGRITRADLMATAPFFAVAMVEGLIAIYPHHAAGDPRFSQPDWNLPSALACVGWTIFFLLGNWLVPFGLLPEYSGFYGNPLSVLDLLPWVALATMAALLWCARPGWGRHVLFGFGFFLVNLVPILVFTVMRYTLMVWTMNHNVYLPGIGLIGLMVAGLGVIDGRSLGSVRIAVRGVVAIIIAVLAWQSHVDAGWWVSEPALWARILKYEPGFWLAHQKYAQSLIGQARFAEAADELRGVIAVHPRSLDAHYNLAQVYNALGHPDAARAQLEDAVKLDPQDPEAYIKLASLLVRGGRKDEALAEYDMALKVLPESPQLRYNIGSLYLGEGRLPEAVDQLGLALKLDPGLAQAHENLGSALAQLHRVPEALEHFQAAVDLRPSYVIARANLARALVQVGRIDEAIAQFEQILVLDPDNAQARQNLSALHQYEALHSRAEGTR